VRLYDIGRKPVTWFFERFFGLEVIGRENVDRVPPERGILFCSNHISNLDPPAVGVAVPRELSYMAKEELFKIPLFKQLIVSLNAFPVKRGAGDRQALKTALKILNDGRNLLMFPEGHRNKSGVIGPAKPGAGFLALRSDAAVIPVAIIGRYKLFGKMKIVIGEPIDLSELKARKAKAGEAAEAIMERIKALKASYE
jgi:1-acyl-sn-glycerol-3-phosphate acyltransferase